MSSKGLGRGLGSLFADYNDFEIKEPEKKEKSEVVKLLRKKGVLLPFFFPFSKPCSNSFISNP